MKDNNNQILAHCLRMHKYSYFWLFQMLHRKTRIFLNEKINKIGQNEKTQSQSTPSRQVNFFFNPTRFNFTLV